MYTQNLLPISLKIQDISNTFIMILPYLRPRSVDCLLQPNRIPQSLSTLKFGPKAVLQ